MLNKFYSVNFPLSDAVISYPTPPNEDAQSRLESSEASRDAAVLCVLVAVR